MFMWGQEQNIAAEQFLDDNKPKIAQLWSTWSSGPMTTTKIRRRNPQPSKRQK